MIIICYLLNLEQVLEKSWLNVWVKEIFTALGLQCGHLTWHSSKHDACHEVFHQNLMATTELTSNLPLKWSDFWGGRCLKVIRKGLPKIRNMCSLFRILGDFNGEIPIWLSLTVQEIFGNENRETTNSPSRLHSFYPSIGRIQNINEQCSLAFLLSESNKNFLSHDKKW